MIGTCGDSAHVCGSANPLCRGSIITSRLANHFPDRFLGFAFLSLGYFPPSPDFDIDSALVQSKAAFGYELFGYWPFMSRDDAYEIIERNVRSILFMRFERRCSSPRAYAVGICFQLVVSARPEVVDHGWRAVGRL
jgi:hypothetical protein